MRLRERSLDIKPIILVCGANYSGTSMVVKLLMDNGGWSGELDKSFSVEVPYPTYENKFFQGFCSRMLEISQGGYKEEEFTEYIKKTPKDKAVILKYPKAVVLAASLMKFTERPIKMVFVIRDFLAVMKSAIVKNRSKQGDELTYYANIYDWGVYYPGDFYPAIFERILKKKEIKPLLDFCELKPEKIVTSAIKLSMVNYGNVN